MTEAERKAARRDAFTLSMVDLFGCGFIAATFLFVFNMLQPLIDAEERTGSLAAATAGQAGDGRSGPVFLSIASTQPLKLADTEVQPVQDGHWYRYEFILPDSSALRWPHRVGLGLADPDVPATVNATLTVGQQIAGVSLAGWADNDPMELTFALGTTLSADIDRPFEHTAEIELSANRRDKNAYSGRFNFFSTKPVNAAVKWSGSVSAVTIARDEEERLRFVTGNPDADCTVVIGNGPDNDFAYCGKVADRLPDPSDEMSRMSAAMYPPGTCWTLVDDPTCPLTPGNACAQIGNGRCGPLATLGEIGGSS